VSVSADEPSQVVHVGLDPRFCHDHHDRGYFFDYHRPLSFLLLSRYLALVITSAVNLHQNAPATCRIAGRNYDMLDSAAK
jgi:hypothetical protein